MTPAAYHRQVEPGNVTRLFVDLASLFVTAAMIPMMMGLCIEVYLLGRVILRTEVITLVISVSLLTVFIALWFVFPLIMRHWHVGGSDDRT